MNSTNIQTETLILFVYAIIEIIGIIGNIYVISWSLCGGKKTLTKHLLGNIAAAHLIYLLTVPPLRIWKLFSKALFPMNTVELPFEPCDNIAPIETFTTSVVVLSFYALGIERYNAASRIHKPYTQVPNYVFGRLFVIWISALFLAVPDTLLIDNSDMIKSIRCPADYYANPRTKTLFSPLFTFARLYNKSRLFWLMTFFFLLPLIYTVLGAVIIAVKSAQYRHSGSGMQIKARDERRMNALIVAILVGFLLCWIPHYSYELITEYAVRGKSILGSFCIIMADMRYYFITFGCAINPILLGLAGPDFWCRKKLKNNSDTVVHSLLGSEEKL